MATLVKRFSFDQWLSVPVDDLLPGDLFQHQGTVGVVTQPVSRDGSKAVLKAEPYEPGAIVINVEWSATNEAMDCVGTSLQTFPDGTGLLTDFEAGEQVYSPRLPICELEDFCQQNLHKYREHFAQHQDSILAGDTVPFSPFW